ncbi:MULTISPECIES: hypothetical protein [unclassified Streptomyces]|uniref:hypothetical protein n=1 Tax=unclassified Streptomyces TaxID=2593676 RepID=UPI002E174630|nr:MULTISPECIES: hypothetical protein [unclassified Streptomyces]
MSEPNKGTDQQNEATKRKTASRARDSADKATAPVSDAAEKTEAKAVDAAVAAQRGAERVTEGAADAVGSAARGVEAGRQAAVAATGQVTTVARTAWTAVAHRKMLAMGVGAGVTAVGAASYAVGRRAGRRP